MGDSDEEYSHGRHGSSNHQSLNNSNSFSKKNRDKFHRERDDSASGAQNSGATGTGSSNPGGAGGAGYARRDWNDDRNNRGGSDSWKSNRMTGGGGGGGYQRMNNAGSDYGSRKYGHQSSPGHYDTSPPPQKRRKDWDSGPSYGSGMNQQSYDYHSASGAYSSKAQYQNQAEPEYPTQPPLLSFKQFLQQQDDSISDDDAVKKYNDYKIDFKKTQINNFFLEHKEEEWFKSRYHPDENYKRRNEQNQFILNRLDVFMELMNKGWLDDVSAEFDKSKELIRFLDAVVIKLEGGSDNDLKSLLDGVDESTAADAAPAPNETDQTENVKKENKKEDDDGVNDPDVDESKSNDDKKSETNGASNGKSDEEKGEEKSRHDSGSESGAYTDSDSDDSDKKRENGKKKRSTSNASGAKSNNNNKNNGESAKKQLHKTTSIFMRNLAPSVTKQDLENLAKSHDGFKRVALSDPAPERGFYRRGWITFDSNIDVKKVCWSLQNIKLKDTNPGAIVNRELTNRIRPIVNLVTHHKSVVKNDIKLAMNIIQNMDKKWNLWQEVDDKEEVNGTSNGTANAYGTNNGSTSANDSSMTSENNDTTTNEKQDNEKETMADANKTDPDDPNKAASDAKTAAQTDTDYAKLEESAFSKLIPQGSLYLKHKYNGPNPLLNNITDYLVDEVNAEEEEFLGEVCDSGAKSAAQAKSSTGSFDIEIDRNYNKVLDRLVLYLRVVHSIDYYNSIEYHQEDSMPNRCGIMFVRPALPLNAASASLKITNDEISQYTKQFEVKLKPYIEYKEKLDLDMAKKLGIKDQKEEIEKFIKLNTQELAADRWLCPLSGKRFKGPEFIRKHLFYKHMEKIIEVKKEVDYFNNYVFDPKRPQLPEHPSNTKSQSQSSMGGSGMPAGQTHHHHYQSSYSNSSPMGNQSGYGNTALLPQPMIGSGQMGYGGAGSMSNRSMNTSWQSGAYMSDMMPSAYGNTFQPSFAAGMGGVPAGGGYQGGYKKPMYGYQNRRGKDSREMIQYKDLDAPDDA